MALNHVSPHKYGNKKALGIYRGIATCFMFILFSFLTVYETLVSHNRVYFTLAWWVSLSTLLFFALSIIDYHAYFFSTTAKTTIHVSDGSNPFYQWKVITFVNSVCLLTGLHLAILTVGFKKSSGDSLSSIEMLLYLGPLALTLIDWCFNRIYLNVTMMIWYPIATSICYFAYYEIVRYEATAEKIKEF